MVGHKPSAVGKSHGQASAKGARQLPPNLRETRVTFKNEAGEKLTGLLLMDQDSSFENVVVLCHGYASSKDGFIYPQLSLALATANLGVLRFDFAGNGESEGTFEFGNYLREVQDVRAAVQYVRNHLQKKVLAIVGHSKGGDVVLLYASQYDGDVEYIVNVAGRFDMRRGIKERFGADILDRINTLGQIPQSVRNDTGTTINFLLTKASMEERMTLDMAAAAKRISLTEVLTIHGTADTVIPVEDAHMFAKAIKPHTLSLVEGADHNFRSSPAHAEQVAKRILDYLTRGL